MPIKHQKHITRQDLKDNPDIKFVFGDNFEKEAVFPDATIEDELEGDGLHRRRSLQNLIQKEDDRGVGGELGIDEWDRARNSPYRPAGLDVRQAPKINGLVLRETDVAEDRPPGLRILAHGLRLPDPRATPQPYRCDAIEGIEDAGNITSSDNGDVRNESLGLIGAHDSLLSWFAGY